MEWLCVCLIVFLSMTVNVGFSQDCKGSLPEDEYRALESLYQSTGGDSWFFPLGSSYWVFPSNLSDPCTDDWFGLECTTAPTPLSDCSVYSIDLYSMNLVGSLPESLSHLSLLHSLMLSENQIRGTIPSILGLLEALDALDLESASLTGTIPTELGQLTKCSQFRLSQNLLSGSIPTELSKLGGSLVLYGNFLSGTIPSELGQLSSVDQFMLDNNQLTGTIPAELAQLADCTIFYLDNNLLSGSLSDIWQGDVGKDLEFMSLATNMFTGTLPLSLSALSKIVNFDISHNAVSGPIHAEIFTSSSLQSVVMPYNLLTGGLQPAFSQLASLSPQTIVILSFGSNNITGSIPTQVGLFSVLRQLNLFENPLTGTLPTELGQVTMLSTLNIYSTHIRGSIPSELGLLSTLSDITLYSNSLSGSIPWELGHATNLIQLLLFDNCLSGTIPDMISKLAGLRTLYLYSNLLTGSIPPSIYQLAQLQQLYLYSNQLTGRLSVAMTGLSELQYLGLNDNLFTGHIPPEWGQLSSVVTMTLQFNYLVGSVPSELSAATALQYLNAGSCGLSGSISSALMNMPRLEYLVLSLNHLTGTIPGDISQDRNIKYLILNGNRLTGSISSSIGRFRSLQVVNLNHNRLVASLPHEICVPALQELFVSGNRLTGSLPSALSSLRHLAELDVSDNLLESTIPSTLFTNGSQLLLLNMSFNHLSGHLDQVFPSNYLNISLKYVDLAHNGLSGSLPPGLFSLPHLTTLSLYSNCFVGRLPADICAASKLQVLILNGLGSGESCRAHLPPIVQSLVHVVFRGYFVQHLLIGSIPRCVWGMPSLQTLQASGNGLSGPLGDLPATSHLVNLNVESNALTGTIPESIQTWGQFFQLGLGSNRLAGTLASTFAISPLCTKLDMSVNRLSGTLPVAMYKTKVSLNVLDGNLFQCTNREMPPSDPNHLQTQCGSDNMASALILISVLAVTAAVLIVVLVSFRAQQAVSSRSLSSQVYPVFTFNSTVAAVLSIVHSWNFITYVDPKHDAELLYYKLFLKFLYRMRQVVCLVCLLFLTVCMTSFVGLKSWGSDYATHAVQYLWLPSSAYLHGATPAAVILLSVALSHQLLTWYEVDAVVSEKPAVSTQHNVYLSVSTAESPASLEEDMMPVDSISDTEPRGDAQQGDRDMDEYAPPNIISNHLQRCDSVLHQYILPLLLQFLNVVIITAVNGVYVAFVFQNLTRGSLLTVQAALGLFKLSWNQMFLPWSMSRLHHLSHRTLLTHQVFMGIFNYIAGPVLATYLTDSTCLYFAIFGQPAVSSYIETQSSGGITCSQVFSNNTNAIECSEISSVTYTTTTLVPPWIYSNQCSSALIINYVPVFLFAYGVSGVIVPFFTYWLATMPSQKFDRLVPVYVKKFVLRDTLWDTHRGLDDSVEDPNRVELSENETVWTRTCRSPSPSPNPSHTHRCNHRYRGRCRRLFNARSVMSALLLDFALLVTFGLASPLLSAAVAIKVVSTVGVWRVLIDRFLGLRMGALLSSSSACERVENAVQVVASGCRSALFVVVVVAGLFWGLVVLDMVGDVYGRLGGGIAVLVSIIGIPAIFLVGRRGFGCQVN